MRTGDARIVIEDAAAAAAKPRTLAEAKPVNDTAGIKGTGIGGTPYLIPRLGDWGAVELIMVSP